MTIEELKQALDRIVGNDAISRAKRRAIIILINQAEG